MAWLRLDDGFVTNPKIVQLTDAELRVWLRVLCVCATAKDPTVDQITRREVPGLTLARCRRYHQIGLLDDAPNLQISTRSSTATSSDFEVHDWLHYQPKDATNHERQARWRSRNHAGSDPVSTVTGTVTDDVTANGTGSVTLSRARVFPSRSSKEESAAAVPPPAAADELLDKLKTRGWDTDQIAAASGEPERAAAWLEVASREARSNVGAYAWSGFDGGSWPVRDAAEKQTVAAPCESCGIGGGAHASDCELAEPADPVDDGEVDERGLVLLVATLVKNGAGAQQVGERAERWARERTDDPAEVGRLILRSGELFAAAGASSTGGAA